MEHVRLHLVRERGGPPRMRRRVIRDSRDAYEAVEDLETRDREVFVVLYLDTTHRPIGREEVSVGTLTASLVHPREVFKGAILASAHAVIIAHNHPSGEPDASKEDIAVTRRLIEAGHLLGIPVLDHIVVGHQCCVTLRDSRGCYDLPWQDGSSYQTTDFLAAIVSPAVSAAEEAETMPITDHARAEARRILDVATWEKGYIRLPGKKRSVRKGATR